MMRMMMEQPEHSFAYAFETLTTYVRMPMSITTKTRFGDSSVQVRQQSLDQPGTWGLVLHSVGLLLVFGGRY